VFQEVDHPQIRGEVAREGCSVRQSSRDTTEHSKIAARSVPTIRAHNERYVKYVSNADLKPKEII
jgi:hypothetical protein